MPAPVKAAPSDRKYQIVVYGATGLTGYETCAYLAKYYNDQIRWAIAGRNKKRLEKALQKLFPDGTESKKPDIIVARIDNDAELTAMTSSTQVLLQAAGPYAWYSTEIVNKCVETVTHCLDLTGETIWAIQMARKHHKAAKAVGCSIVQSCGFDALPSDMLAYLAANHLKSVHNLPIGRMEVVIDLKSFASRGTLFSLLNYCLESRAHFVHAVTPYSLCEEGFQGADSHSKDPINPGTSPLLGLPIRPHLLCRHNTRLVRRTHSLLDYGPAFTYTENFLGKSPLYDHFMSTVTPLLLPFAKFPPINWLLQLLVLCMGSVGTRYVMDRGHLRAYGVGEAAGGGGIEAKRVKVEFLLSGMDGAYRGSGLMLGEMGVWMVGQEVVPGGVGAGVVTPMVVGGKGLVGRLMEAVGMEIRVTDV